MTEQGSELECLNDSVQNSTGRPWYWAVLTLAALLRLCVIWMVATHNPHTWLFFKGRELGALALSLSTGKGYSSPFGGFTGPTAYLAPGYPAIVASLFRLFGVYSFASVIAILVLQVAFSVATTAVLMYLAGKLFGRTAANLAGIFWAVSLPLLWMPTIFWDTSLSALVIMGAVALALRLAERGTSALWAVTGLLCGGALLTNPALLLVLAGVFGWAAWMGRVRTAAPRYAPLLAVAMAGLVLTPWTIRNEHALHAFIPLRSNLGFELWNGNQPGKDGDFDEALHPDFNAHEFALYVSEGEVRYMAEKKALAQGIIRTHRGEFAMVSLKRVVRFWTGLAQAGTGQTSGLIVAHVLVTTIAGLTGLVLLFRRRRELAILFALPLLLFPVPYYITHPDVRFRLLLDPLLTLLGAGLIIGMKTVREHKLFPGPNDDVAANPSTHRMGE